VLVVEEEENALQNQLWNALVVHKQEILVRKMATRKKASVRGCGIILYKKTLACAGKLTE
jgi:hypothetical protein